MEDTIATNALSYNPLALINVILLVILNFTITIVILKDLYSKSWYVIKSFTYLWRVWVENRYVEASVPCKKICGSEKFKTSLERHLDYDDEGVISSGEVEIVMRKLGTSFDPNGDKLAEKVCAVDIASLFEGREPVVEELHEAFSMFDENNDGFIDAKELMKILCKLCSAKISEADCSSMIRACNQNGDEVIEFDEFVRLVADSFS